MSTVLRHVIESIGPASRAHAVAAAAAVAPAGAPVLERLAHALGGAQHTPRPRGARRQIVVAIGDHGAGDPGIAMGSDHPTVVAARAIDAGNAALVHVARSSRTPILLVDAGAREPDLLPPAAIRLGRGATRDLFAEPAMTVVDAVLGLEAGIALAVTLAEPGLDVLAVGTLGVGSELAAAALLGVATGNVPDDLADDGATAAAARGAEAQRPAAGPVDALAAFGGGETCMLAGLMLGAASMNIPVILDGYATGAAALAASQLAPAINGYLIAAHGGHAAMPAILSRLSLTPVFEIGLGHGEGTGAAMLLPLIDQVAAIVDRA
jgi:nicotinate-nucleotide--dimethylbenzimidazole phosphoribosyltransferase